jgi:hypothetical protein
MATTFFKIHRGDRGSLRRRAERARAAQHGESSTHLGFSGSSRGMGRNATRLARRAALHRERALSEMPFDAPKSGRRRNSRVLVQA